MNTLQPDRLFPPFEPALSLARSLHEEIAGTSDHQPAWPH